MRSVKHKNVYYILEIKMKKTLVSIAVASALMGVNAQADVTLYGRINNSININDVGGKTTTNVFNVYSRLGVKASMDLGNGMTGFGRYEFSTFTDAEGASGTGFLSGGGGIDDTRLGYVGIKGGFGEVQVGQTWSAFYNTVGTNIDPMSIAAYFLYSSVIGGPYRVSNNIKYSNSFGPVAMEIDYRIAESKNDERGGDSNLNTEKLGGQEGAGIGITYTVNDIASISAAFDTEGGSPDANGETGPDTDRIGISGKVSISGFETLLGYQKVDTGTVEKEQTQIHVKKDLIKNLSGIVGYGQGDFSTGEEPTAITAGLYYTFGESGYKVWYEGVDLSSTDGVGLGDHTTHVIGMRIDF